MPQQVRSALLEVLQSVKKWDESQAEEYLLQLKKQQRYITDTWG
jgi:sulfite reductase alpha subunit-like flavoprotein